MEVSLSMILELLNLPHTNYAGSKPVFHSVKFLTTGTDPLLRSDILYITSLSLAQRLYDSGRTLCCLCSPDVPPRNPSAAYSMAVLDEEISPQELYRMVQNIFHRLKSWDFSLYTSLLGRGDLKQLLDCSQDILKNHVHVVEPFTRLLAYTKDIDIYEDDIHSFYSKFLDNQDILPALQSRILEQARASSDNLCIMEGNSLFAHPSVTKLMTFGGSYTIFVIMICGDRPLSDGIQDLFLHLCKYIRLYVENNPSTQPMASTQETFINGILNRTLSKNAANIHATLSLKLPIKSNFNLYKIVFKGRNKPSEKVMKAISLALPQSRLSYYQDGIVMLNHYELPGISKLHRSNQKALQPILEKYGAICGISNPFHTLYEMTAAYEQASIVLEFYGSEKLQFSFPFIPCRHDFPFFSFDDYTLCHFFVETGDKDPLLFLQNPYRDSIISIKEFDTRHSTRYLETLYVYLTNGRSTTAVSEYLHISKDTVSHSIHSIQHLIYGTLDSWQVRMKLLLAFEYLNLHPEEL